MTAKDQTNWSPKQLEEWARPALEHPELVEVARTAASNNQAKKEALEWVTKTHENLGQSCRWARILRVEYPERFEKLISLTIQKTKREEKEMTQGWTTLESRSMQFDHLMEQLIAAETDPQRKTGLEKSRKHININEVERIFSPVNIIIEQEDVSQNHYHSGSGLEHLLRIIFKAPDDKREKQEPTYRVIEISLESNDLHYRKDGVSTHDWRSLIQISKWNAIEYGDGLMEVMYFVCDIGGEKHLLTIDDDGEYELHSQTAYRGKKTK